MKGKKNLKYGILALTLALFLSACSKENVKEAKDDSQNATNGTQTAVEEEVKTTEDDIDDKKEEKSQQNQKEGLRGIENKEFSVSLDDAISKFKEVFADDGIEIGSVDFDEDDGKYVYDIQGFKDRKEFEAKIHAESGEILSKEEDDDDDGENDDMGIDFQSIISPEEAIKKALENSSAYAVGWDLKYDDGILKYEIDLEGADDVDLDAKTGNILNK